MGSGMATDGSGVRERFFVGGCDVFGVAGGEGERAMWWRQNASGPRMGSFRLEAATMSHAGLWLLTLDRQKSRDQQCRPRVR
jgi:hypothetical protein